jgi:hypothetical protein
LHSSLSSGPKYRARRLPMLPSRQNIGRNVRLPECNTAGDADLFPR